jgi:cation diffusion facilitator family transporter
MTTAPSVALRERRAALAAVVVGALLMGAKFAAYHLTRSTVVFSDAMESIANVLASGVAFYALTKAHTPADEDHPYGHGKAEFISAGFEGGVICVAAMLILVKAIDQAFFATHEIVQLNIGVWLIAATIVINGGLGWWLWGTGRRSGSMTLEADGKHLLGDALTSAGAILAMLLVKATRIEWLDPLLAAGFGLYVGWQGWGLVRRSIAGLTDEQDAEDARRIEAILQSHVDGAPPRICSFHKVRHRHSGRYHWVDLHIRVPADMDTRTAHDIASTIEEEIEGQLGEGNATAHVEPCSPAGAPCPHPRAPMP